MFLEQGAVVQHSLVQVDFIHVNNPYDFNVITWMTKDYLIKYEHIGPGPVISDLYIVSNPLKSMELSLLPLVVAGLVAMCILKVS